MSQPNTAAILRQALDQASKAGRWLDRSLKRCKSVSLSQVPSEDDFDALENLASRFARLSDILLQKVFRCIDQIELEPAGTLIDVINRAAKRGIVEDPTVMRRIREVRNAIAHEYADEDLVELFKEIRNLAPTLRKILTSSATYSTRHLPQGD